MCDWHWCIEPSIFGSLTGRSNPAESKKLEVNSAIKQTLKSERCEKGQASLASLASLGLVKDLAAQFPWVVLSSLMFSHSQGQGP